MNDSFISVSSSFIFTWGSPVGRGIGHAYSALNLGCGITVNGEGLTGSAKWEDILKVYEFDKQNVLYHLLLTMIHSHLNPG